MPNWCAGTLKIRGSVENLKRFFEEGLDRRDAITGEYIDKNEWLIKDIGEYYISYMFKNVEPHVKGTNRAFIADWKVYVEFDELEDGYPVIINFEQAWDIRADDWVNLSKEYGLNFRLYGFERGNEFCRDVEVINGELTIDNTIKYQDYAWECPMPEIGG